MAIRSTWPQHTTVLAGGCLIVSAVALLSDALRPSVEVLAGMSVPLYGTAVTVSAHVVLLIAFTVMAFGVGHEVGLAGMSWRGRAYLLAWGFSALVTDLFLSGPWEVQSFPLWAAVLQVLQLGFGVVGLLSAHSVYRTRILSGLGRWVLIPLAALQFALVVGRNIAAPVSASVRIFQSLYIVELLVVLFIGLVFLLFGRIEAVRYRADTIRENW